MSEPSFVPFASSAFSVPSRSCSGVSRAAAFSATSRAVAPQHLAPPPPAMAGPVPFLGPRAVEDMEAKEASDASCAFVQAPFPAGIEMGSLVFAKVKGHAWWPGRISGVGIASSSILRSMHGTGLLVFFFGEHNYSLVSSDAIAPFEEFMAKASRKRRSKVLRAAIREAEAVHNGELVIDESAFVAEEEPAASTGGGSKAKTSRSKKRTVEKETFEQQRRSFRRRVMRRIALFPPEALMDDYPQLASSS